MLVISRKVSESIMIGDDIEIIVSEISSDKVKLAVKAPKNIAIMRHELLEVREQNREASAPSKEQAINLLKNLLK